MNQCVLTLTRTWIASFCGVAIAGWSLAPPASAQVIPDGTLGTESSVVNFNVLTPSGLVDLVNGGALRGSNLFHSFSTFNVNPGQRLYFANPAAVQNIISRVTGSSASDIYGTLGVLGNANLFLINPNGIVFGPNAELDIRGSFVASTADSVLFNGGAAFSTTNPAIAPLLTVNAPLGLASWLPNTGNVTNLGASLTAGGDLSLAGRNLDIRGSLTAGGDLSLVATAEGAIADSPLQAVRLTSGNGLLIQGNNALHIDLLSHPDSGVAAGGDLTLRSDQAVLTDAYFSAGGDFALERLDGSPGSAFSPQDPVFEVTGNFALANFTGASLQILAGGNVTLGDIVITGAGGVFNDSTVVLSNGDTLTLTGTTVPTLDVRAGTTGFFGAPTPNGTSGGANITVDSIEVPGGLVFLTNRYAPNANSSGNIAVGFISTADGAGGGDVVIDSRGEISFEEINVSGEDAVTFDLTGDGGDVTLLARGNIVIPFLAPPAALISYGLAGGNITLISDRAVIMEDGPFGIDPFDLSFIESLSDGTQPGGDIVIEAPRIAIGGAILTTTFGDGVGGSIFLRGDTITANQADISAGTFGTAPSGNVTIEATNALTLDYTFLGTYTEGDAGATAGDVTVTTGQLTAVRGGQIVSESGMLATGADAGNVTVTADSILLSGFQPEALVPDFAPSGIISASYAEGNSGTVTVNTRTLTLRNGGTIGTSAFGDGNSGRVRVTATEAIAIDGVAAFGGDLFPSNITSEVFTGAVGDGGLVNVSTAVLSVTNGGTISTSTDGDGTAGSVVITATQSALFDGFTGDRVSSASVESLTNATGPGGTLTIRTPNLTVRNGAAIEVGSTGVGDAGNLSVVGNVLVLDRGLLSAETLSSAGGNIRLQIRDVIAMTNGSRISTSAGTALAGGDGGNIDIRTTYLVATPNNNNDITANAFTGAGGRVDVRAQGIFGLVPRSRAELEQLLGTTDPVLLDPINLPTSDITAISRDNPRLDGQVVIESPNIDPSQGTVPLPSAIVDASRLIAQGCSSGGTVAQEIGSLVVTGRGGLPSNPAENLSGSQLLLDWVSLDSTATTRDSIGGSAVSVPSAPRQIQEVQTLAVGADGQVVLVGQAGGEMNAPGLPTLTCAAKVHQEVL